MTLPAATLDHVVINARDDMDRAADIYRRLGFTLTERGYHSLGSTNHLAMFGTDYLELIAVPKGATSGRLDLLEFSYGLNGLVFGSEDSAITYGALAKAGVPVEPPVEFMKSIEDDLNTPGAMAALFALSSDIERGMTAGDEGAVAEAKGRLIAAASILGVLQADPAEWFSGVDEGLKAEVEGLLEQRAAARTAKNWAEADRIRDRLNELNVVVMDGPQGATWRMKG